MNAASNRLVTEATVTIPAVHTSLGDQMDRAMDRLRTVHLSISPENHTWLDEGNLTSIWATLEQCIRDLEPVRNVLQGCNEQTGRVPE
ncbi:MAG TPA: hypothetical protein VGN98_17220 [Tianweitania sediminis]|jgi:hypothetical protein|nr:hypothetical protein [Tianweitania sediminis]